MASTTGDYRGSSANISGEGFAKMNFITRSVRTGDFDAWVRGAAQSMKSLTMDSYNELAKPGVPDGSSQYMLSDAHLYDKILIKYMAPTNTTETDTTMESMPGMEGAR
jgi:cytochrome o ubiquinol oxidase subunit 2